MSIPGRKCRPVLVREIETNDQLGRAIITVSQGTSIKDSATRLRYELRDLIIHKPAEIAAHGLHVPTRFDLRKKKRIPVIWCREFFQWPTYAHRLYMGKLNIDTLRRLTNRQMLWR
ncbi:hypothetical protein V1292_005137 [Bradyrhizobium sp. AZCC 1719]|uniref:hypothetical protein n=1 Tax=Bradyrhizobium sp. AZCC 1719 TaxID=3117028 RepID=UPI002FF282D8